MTEKDKRIQDLTKRLKVAEEQINVMIGAYSACRYCKYLDADCFPGSEDCRPEWNKKGVLR